MNGESKSQGRDMRRASADCAPAMEALRNSWLDRPLPGEKSASLEGPAASPQRDAMDHLKACARCQKDARDFDQVNGALLSGFSALVRVMDLPTRERMDEIIRKVREEPAETQLLKRLRRPFRIILWTAFYAFTLLACSVLAVALYRALKAL